MIPMRKLCGLVLLSILCPVAHCQTAADPMAVPNIQFLNCSTGICNPLGGGTVTTYVAGTTTPLATCASSALTGTACTTPNSNPIQLNSSGFNAAGSGNAGIWPLPTRCYKFLLKDSDGNTIWTTDNICNRAGILQAALAGPAGAGLVGFSQANSYANGTVGAKLKQVVSVTDPPYNATGDGSTNDTAAITAAIDAVCSNGGEVLIPGGKTFIIVPPTTAYILPVCSGLTIDGLGTLKIKANAGSFDVVFGPQGTALTNFAMKDFSFDFNSGNNVIPNSGDLMAHPRIMIQTGASYNVVFDSLHISSPRGVQTIYLGVNSINARVTNNLIDSIGGGSVCSDSSVIFANAGSDGLIVSGNRLVASSRNACLAVAAIETHGSFPSVTGNTITDMYNGANIAQSSGTVVDPIFSHNIISGACQGASFWSNNTSGASVTGMKGLVAEGNAITLNWLSYGSDCPNPSGLFLTDTSNLPFVNIKTSQNVITYDLSTSGSDAFGTESIGIGYIDDTGSNSVQGWDASGNSIINAPANAMQVSAGGSNYRFDGNLIVNPGSNLNAGLGSTFRAGILFNFANPVTGIISVKGGSISDTFATCRMAYGVNMSTLNTTGFVIDTAVSAEDLTCTSLVKAVTPNTITQLPAIRLVANVPAAKVLPAVATLASSTYWSVQEALLYTWNGGAYDFFIPHNTAPTVSLCGTSPSITGNDRVGRVAFGSGTVTSCTITFGTVFTSAPEGVVTLRSGGGASAGNIRYTPTTTNLVIASGDGSTNYAGGIFSWILEGN